VKTYGLQTENESGGSIIIIETMIAIRNVARDEEMRMAAMREVAITIDEDTARTAHHQDPSLLLHGGQGDHPPLIVEEDLTLPIDVEDLPLPTEVEMMTGLLQNPRATGRSENAHRTPEGLDHPECQPRGRNRHPVMIAQRS
jgi:hypothetical protein